MPSRAVSKTVVLGREWPWQRRLLDRLPWLGTPELLQRVAVTFCFLGMLRGMSFVPLPYLDMQAVPDYLMTGKLCANGFADLDRQGLHWQCHVSWTALVTAAHNNADTMPV